MEKIEKAELIAKDLGITSLLDAERQANPDQLRAIRTAAGLLPTTSYVMKVTSVIVLLLLALVVYAINASR